MKEEGDSKPINLRLLESTPVEVLDKFTPEERALLAKSESDLKAEVEQFSFEVTAFETRMKSGEDWHRVIQAHLYLDHVITEMLWAALQRPDAVGCTGWVSRND